MTDKNRHGFLRYHARRLLDRFQNWRHRSSLAFAIAWVEGIDVSKWQGLIDWLKAAAGNFKFVYIRAGYGLNKDEQFDRNSIEAPKFFKRIGYYLYVYPNLSAVAQARAFANLIRDKHWTLPPAADYEQNSGLSPSQLRYHAELFVATLKAELGIDYVTVYTRQSFWDWAVAASVLFGKLPLWAARYGAYLLGPWSDGYYKFRDWVTWKIWQYTETLDGKANGMQSYGLDGNRFNGTVADLDRFIEEYGRPVEEPEPEGRTMPLRDILLKAPIPLEAGGWLSLTGANLVGMPITVSDLPEGTRGLKLRIIAKSPVPGNYVSFGAGINGEERFHATRRILVPGLLHERNADVMLDGNKIYRTHQAGSSNIDYFVFITGFKVE